MKILHFSTWATGGAAKAASRLSDALIELGEDSRVIHMSSKIPAYIDAAIGKLTDDNNPIFHSYNFFPDNFAKIIKMESPDIIHIHWIGAGFVRPESLSSCKIPIVWTLHDLWPLLGAEHLPLGITRMREGYLTTNRPNKESGLDLNRLVWQRKKRYWSDINITYIAPSKYVHSLAKKSYLIKTTQELNQIYNFVNLDFVPNTKVLDNGDLSILVVGTNLDTDKNKGLDLLLESLKKLPMNMTQKIKITIIGVDTLDPKIFLHFKSYKLISSVNSDTELVSYYQDSTLTIVPSRIETLSYVALESLSCGTPVVAFKVGGIPELVIHNKNGYLAKPYDASDLARGITTILSSPKLRSQMSASALSHVKHNFSKDKIVREHLELYKSILNR